MKRPLALLAAFLLMFVVSATLGIAQANQPLAPETSTTPSSTPTVTETLTETTTPTVTATVTTNPCGVKPAPPPLKAPEDNATIYKTNVKLRWESVPCANKYRILVRQSSKTGTPVQRGKTNKLSVTTSSLSRGYTYFWNIKACAPDVGCTRSQTWRFKIPAPPTAVPPPTGQATSTPPPSGSGTPVPGTPPGNLVNYYTTDRGGTGVYLYDSPEHLYRYECGKDQNLWPHFIVPVTVYNIALWYYPNEKITMQRLDFNAGQVVETKTLTANGSGYVEYNTNASTWTQNHHYHLIFTGQSSKVSWCGHFDIQSGSASQAELEALPHTHADVEKVYRAAGLPDPQ